MKYSLFTTMIHNGGTNTKNRPRKGAGIGNPSEDKPQCRIVRIGGRKLRNKKSIERHLKGIKAGDRVVLQYAGNYCDYDWAAVSANPDGEHLPAVNFGQFRELYNYAIRQIQTLGATAALLTLPALLPQRFFDHICRNLNRSHILHWVGDDVCRFNRWREEYNDEILSLASHHGLPVIDISRDLLQRSHIENCYDDNGMLPNSSGQAVIAELVAEWNRKQA